MFIRNLVKEAITNYGIISESPMLTATTPATSKFRNELSGPLFPD